MELYKDSFHVDNLELNERTKQLLDIFVDNLQQYKISFPEIIFALRFKNSVYDAFKSKNNADNINDFVATRFCLYYRHFKKSEQSIDSNLKGILEKQCKDLMLEFRQELTRRSKSPYTKEDTNRKKQEIMIVCNFLKTPIINIFNKEDASYIHDFYTKECQNISTLMNKY